MVVYKLHDISGLCIAMPFNNIMGIKVDVTPLN